MIGASGPRLPFNNSNFLAHIQTAQVPFGRRHCSIITNTGGTINRHYIPNSIKCQNNEQCESHHQLFPYTESELIYQHIHICRWHSLSLACVHHSLCKQYYRYAQFGHICDCEQGRASCWVPNNRISVQQINIVLIDVADVTRLAGDRQSAV